MFLHIYSIKQLTIDRQLIDKMAEIVISSDESKDNLVIEISSDSEISSSDVIKISDDDSQKYVGEVCA